MSDKVKIPFNANYVRDNLDKLVTPEIKQFVASQTERDPNNFSLEWWTDFFLGVSLYGIGVGMQSVIK